MKCPHCSVEIHPAYNDVRLNVAPTGMPYPIGKEGGKEVYWTIRYMVCPSCAKAIILLAKAGPHEQTKTTFAYPRARIRPQAPRDVPIPIAEDYNEAAAVLEDSPKASAALSRRCVQSVLREAGFVQHDLGKAIDAALKSNSMPRGLAEVLDAVRNIGNFAAHPIKDTNTGEIVPVEPEEAEWNLDVLDAMFDFYFVQPARNRERATKLNEKLAAAGRAPIKRPPEA